MRLPMTAVCLFLILILTACNLSESAPTLTPSPEVQRLPPLTLPPQRRR